MAIHNRISITQKIAGLLIATVCGAIITGIFSYSYFVQTSGDVSAVNVAGRQRMLSKMLFEYATMVHEGQDEDRKDLLRFVAEFDQALIALEFGGTVIGRKLSAAPPELQDEITSTKQLWQEIKTALLVIADQPADDPESAEAYQFVSSFIDQLMQDSDDVVSAFELRSTLLKQKTLLVIVLTICFDFAFLLVGTLTLKRYINDRNSTTKLLRLTQFSVDNAGEAVFRIRPDGRFAYVNESACQLAGRTPAEMLTLFLWNVDINLDWKAWPELWREIKRRGSITMEREFRREDGRSFVIELRVNHLQHDDSEYAVGFVRDITERKRAEEANVRLSRAIEQAAESIIITDTEGIIQYVNPAFEKITGYSEAEAIGQNPRILKSGQHDEAFYKQMWKTLSSGQEWYGEIINRRKDGALITESAVITPVTDSRGRIVNYIAVNNDITERKRAEEALRESEALYRNLIETTSAVAWEVDIESMRFTYISPQIMAITGYPVEEWIDFESWKERIHPEDRKGAVDFCQVETVKGLDHILEYRMIAADGSIVVIRDVVSVIKEHNKPVFLRGYFLDITERRQAEEALKESEELLRAFMNSATDSFVLFDAQLNLIDINKAGETRFGVRREDVIKMNIVDIVPDIKETGRYNKYLEVIETGQALAIDDLIPHPGFGKMHLSLRAFRVNEGLGIIFADITERKLAEDKVAHWAAFARNNPAPVLSTDLGGRITLMNPAARELFGKDVTGESITPVISSAADLFSNPVQSTLSVNIEQRLGGEIYLFSFQRDEAIDSIYVYGSNITETKRLQELESRAARLETAGTIAAQVAHDFNNLLAPMMAYPEFIHEELQPGNKAHAYLDTIEGAAKKMANINQDLLTMGRRGHYNQEVIDLNQSVVHAAREMEARTKTMTCKMDLSENLLKIKGGSAQIHRLLTNLIVNAQDAMEDVGHLTIRTENYYADDTSIAYGRVTRGEYVKLTVSDNGCGIPEDIIQKILDPFFSTKMSDKKRGSGLGLSIVDAVMKDHNGYLDLSSKVGQGTSFYLYFPTVRDSAPGKDEPENTVGGTEKVLVIDDDEVQREVSSRLLRTLGYDVTAVDSGEKGMKFLRENPQDLLIIDMAMPGGIDGTETYRRILEFAPHQKAIILSGFSEAEQIHEAQKLGAGAFVRKPITKSVIAAAVRTELDRQPESVKL